MTVSAVGQTDNSKLFTIVQTTTAGAVACAAACPLAQIPASVWQSLLRRPWRTRHPVLFWGAIILILGALGFAAGSSGKDGGLMGGDRIALVSVTGPIVNVEPTLEWLRTVTRNPSVKGVLVRVDSPGGGAAASQEVYDALKNLAQKMPVAVSMGSMAASGGLMVSMAGQRVFANASTVTGSIGVRMDVPQLQGLMDKVGVGQETLVVGQYKDAASYMRPMTAEQRAYFQGLLNNMYDQFVDIVAQGRGMPRAQALKLANGKVYTGQEALALGLVDELGGREMALGWLAQKTGVPAERTLLTRPRESNLLERGLRVEGNARFEIHLDMRPLSAKTFQRRRQPLNTAMAFDSQPQPGLLRFVTVLQGAGDLRQHLVGQL